MPDALVRAERVSRVYESPGGSVTALSEVSFAIAPGDRIALVGPSGSGKTTLLQMIAGIDAPTAGAIDWPALGPAEKLRPAHVALAFQGPSLLPALDVAENVALPLLLAGRTEREAREESLRMLARMDLEELWAKLPEEISGGQSQRVAVARALVVRPALLLADEPTGQQDRAHAGRLLDLILELAAEQDTAVLAATHDASVAAQMSARWTLVDGRLSTEEDPC